FKMNVIFFNNTKIIAPLRNSASQAFTLFSCHNIPIDIAYFEYSTSYSDTIEQLEQYYSLMNGHGILFGATSCGPGAQRAVQTFAETNSHKLVNTTSINECTWMIVKAK
uniref:Receptor ligand binding region domain-containing protein n=2 Tax=Parascaris univalens TaxID=6257 RepID=A0A915C7W7_PARUN